MLYDRLQSDILAARDHREALIVDALRAVAAPLIVVSLNIPGPDKTPAGAFELFRDTLDKLREQHSPLQSLYETRDALGPLSLLATPGSDGDIVKQQCVELEQQQPVMRLLDLDVYTDDGRRLGRHEIGLPPRQCLLCNRPVSQCIRLRSHAYEELVNHVHTLLSSRIN